LTTNILAAGKSYSGLVTINFSHSIPACSKYYAEIKLSDSTWRVLTSGETSPISFVARDIIPGSYTFRLRGILNSVTPTLVSNEYTYTVQPFLK
jgi:hypothetical protein